MARFFLCNIPNHSCLVLVAMMLACLLGSTSFVEAGPFDKVGITCAGAVDEDGKSLPDEHCLAGGVFNQPEGKVFSGTYMCREESFLIFWSRNRTKCVPTIANAVIGEAGDTCGCCGGECPRMCTCLCSGEERKEDHVLVQKPDGLFGGKVEYECISPGKASRKIADEGEDYTCVPDDECPEITAAPTDSPTVA